MHAIVPLAELFRRNGLQHPAVHDACTSCAPTGRRVLDIADTMLLIPDLIGYWLTGVARAERTNASTTGLLNVDHRQRGISSSASDSTSVAACCQTLVEPGVTSRATLAVTLTDALGGDVPCRDGGIT